MLGIYTRKNYLQPKHENYVFRSRTNETLDYEALIQKMLEYNSTITDADIRSVTSVLATMIVRYAGLGYVVQTPFGSFAANACGTGKTSNELFEPENPLNDHDLYLTYHQGYAEKDKMLSDARYERISSAFVQTPEITAVTSIDRNGNESSSRTLGAGGKLRLRGDYLKIDATNTEQGMFLKNKNGSVRIDDYNRNGPSILDGVIPADTAAGTYQVIVVTKPGTTRYDTGIASDTVTITA
jgi:hypothetical protein